MTEIVTIFQKSPAAKTWFCEDGLKLPNRATSYGDGLFETMVWDQNHVRFFDKHLQRLKSGMEVLGLDASMIASHELISLLESFVSGKRKRIRWTVFRAGLGKYTPESAEVSQTLQITEFSAAPSIKEKVDVSSKVQLFPTLWSSFKTLNALPYVLANVERKERELDEIILLDYRGYISESGSSNIFWIKDGIVFTPSLSCSCINGVSRQLILEHLDRNSLLYKEGEFNISELEDASHVFISNCTGISYLASFGQRKFSTQPTLFLNQIFE
ncbi:aminotransferase class IV [Algoriphagus antarcticus]|nr:aminotransferase class IV [Algoriphagus antarcticus]